MAIIQSIVALITRSLGSILSALFGWAVIALFGPAEPREKIWLSALVASAAAWPLLLLGVIWPRLATFVLGFIPVPPWVPAWGIRLVWIVLAIIGPFVLGLVMAARSRGVAAPIPGTVRRKALRKHVRVIHRSENLDSCACFAASPLHSRWPHLSASCSSAFRSEG